MTERPTIDSDQAIARRTLPLIDLTSLGDADTDDDVERLCEAAVTPAGPVAAVCVWPRFVGRAATLLSSTPVGVASVANFPEGDPNPTRAATDARSIVNAGGAEVDVVYPWRSLVGGDAAAGRNLVAATRQEIGQDIVLKVILETGELHDPDLIRTAAGDALDAGADFLKTSTGKTAKSATPEAVAILLDVLAEYPRTAGLKISGGIRSIGQAAEYLALADERMGPGWAGAATLRFGASTLLGNILNVLPAAGEQTG